MSNQNSTVYSRRVKIRSGWLNDVNNVTYGALADANGNPPTTPLQVLENLGISQTGGGTGGGSVAIRVTVNTFNGATQGVILYICDCTSNSIVFQLPVFTVGQASVFWVKRADTTNNASALVTFVSPGVTPAQTIWDNPVPTLRNGASVGIAWDGVSQVNFL